MKKQTHTVLLSTEMEVEAATAREAQYRAQEWLTIVLKGASVPEGMALTKPAGVFSDIAWLAFQLLALEERGEKAAAQVARLRAQVEAELKAEQMRDREIDPATEIAPAGV